MTCVHQIVKQLKKYSMICPSDMNQTKNCLHFWINDEKSALGYEYHDYYVR